MQEGARALGLQVWGDKGVLRWCRSGPLPEVPQQVTRRDVFSLCGKLVSHYPVCGWLRVRASFLKRKASQATEKWDDVVADEAVVRWLQETVQAVKDNDPVKGCWDVSDVGAVIWVDASSIALGAALEMQGCVVEDACWLRKEDAGHINMAELDAVIKGLNLVLAWKATKVEIKTDSAAVYKWISDGLTGKSRLKTKAANEMLVRRRVAIVVALVEEYGLTVTVTLVPSQENKADALTRVPNKWLRGGSALNPEDGVDDGVVGAMARTSEDVKERIEGVHHKMGHPGIHRTLYFVQRQGIVASRRDVQGVVRECDICKSIDPAPVKWKPGDLGVQRVWQRLGMDITHCGGQHYLTLIDCGPSRFAIWRRLRMQTSECVIERLNEIFWERGAPEEILTDNDTAFRSHKFAEFARQWEVRVRFRCAYAASGNGVVERCHRTVKVIAARKGCSIGEAVYLYNVTPRDDHTESSAPANALYNYAVRVCGENDNAPRIVEPVGKYRVGDEVWVKPPHARCNVQYGTGRVTGVISPHAVEVDGVPRHVRDLRKKTRVNAVPEVAPDEEEDDDWMPRRRRANEQEEGEIVEEEEENEPPDQGQDGDDDEGGPRRSARIAARAGPYRRCECDGTNSSESENDDGYNHGGV